MVGDDDLSCGHRGVIGSRQGVSESIGMLSRFAETGVLERRHRDEERVRREEYPDQFLMELPVHTRHTAVHALPSTYYQNHRTISIPLISAMGFPILPARPHPQHREH